MAEIVIMMRLPRFNSFTWNSDCMLYIQYTNLLKFFRTPLHKKWWGVRDEILSDEAGIKDCIFCHGNGFIGGNKTREGALKMAIASLEAEK